MQTAVSLEHKFRKIFSLSDFEEYAYGFSNQELRIVKIDKNNKIAKNSNLSDFVLILDTYHEVKKQRINLEKELNSVIAKEESLRQELLLLGGEKVKTYLEKISYQL